LFDRETVRQFRVSLGWVLSDNFRVGHLPASCSSAKKFSITEVLNTKVFQYGSSLTRSYSTGKFFNSFWTSRFSHTEVYQHGSTLRITQYNRTLPALQKIFRKSRFRIKLPNNFYHLKTKRFSVATHRPDCPQKRWSHKIPRRRPEHCY